MKLDNWPKILLPLLILNVLFLLVLSSAPMVFFPEEGVWYCKELQIQISCERLEDCWMISDGETIQCTWGSNRGSKWMSIGCQDRTTKQFELGEEVFGGKFVSLEENRLVILEPVSNKEYTFIRVEESE